MVVTVTNKTRKIANGIVARVVRDTVTEDGKLVEDTWDWYAQDKAGNIWYLGELTKEYENGKLASTEGSFEAGVDGAQAGIAMPAHPQAGLTYRQEYYAGKAEDKAEIFSLGEQAEVPVRPLQGRGDDQGSESAEAEDPRVQVLRPWCRPGALDRRLRRQRPRGARALHARW